jgi:hypothetical protein
MVRAAAAREQDREDGDDGGPLTPVFKQLSAPSKRVGARSLPSP